MVNPLIKEYFASLNGRLDVEGTGFRLRKPHQHFALLSVKTSGLKGTIFGFGITLSTIKRISREPVQEIRVECYSNDRDGSKCFQRLCFRKDEIEELLGYPLNWAPAKPNKNHAVFMLPLK